jgi:hypothetical protein
VTHDEEARTTTTTCATTTTTTTTTTTSLARQRTTTNLDGRHELGRRGRQRRQRLLHGRDRRHLQLHGLLSDDVRGPFDSGEVPRPGVGEVLVDLAVAREL